MELSSGGVWRRLFIIHGTLLLLLSAPCHAGPIDEDDFETTSKGKCNNGWELCPTAKDRCIPTPCMDFSRLLLYTKTCGLGYAYCPDNGMCVIPCPPTSAMYNPSGAIMEPICVPGKFFCAGTGTCGTFVDCTEGIPGEPPICNFGYHYCVTLGGCVPKGSCPDDDSFMTSELTTCPYGKMLCAATGKCQRSCESDFTGNAALILQECPQGAVWCPAAGRCVVDGVCDKGGNTSLIRCPEGEMLCLTKGNCTNVGECMEEQQERPLPMDIMCPSGQVLCLQTGICAPEGACHDDNSRDDEEGKGDLVGCPDGQVFCLVTGNCSHPSMCEGRQEEEEELRCPDGQVLCLSTGTCSLPSMCEGRQEEEEELRCPDGQVLCLSTGTCSHPSICEDKPNEEEEEIRCPSGLTLCLETGRCSSADECGGGPQGDFEELFECPPGQILCLETGTCSFECREGREDPDDEFEHNSCPPGTIFCLAVGICVPEGSCGPSDGESPSSREETACPPGKTLCLSLGECVEDGMCGVTDDSTDQPDEPFFDCPVGQVFCLETGSCVPGGSCGRGGSPESITPCPGGQVFCLAMGTCVADGACGGVGNPGDGWIGNNDLVCPPNQVFCLASGTCKPVGACEGRPPERMTSMCPRGYVYCLERGECVSVHRGCNLDPFGKICPPGTILSLSSNICVPESNDDEFDMLPDVVCPTSLERRPNSFEYSSCITRQHCPFNHTCCADPETLHVQCVNPEGVPNPAALNMTCLQLSNKKHDTGIECTVPKDCPVASVCCNGSCRSQRGVQTCPPGSLYCSINRKCVKLGKTCGRVCGSGQFYCSATDECTTEKNCEFVSGGAPWTLPGPIMVGGERENLEDAGVKVSDTYSFGDKQPVKAVGATTETFKVIGKTTTYGEWSSRRYPSDPWVVVEPGVTVLTPSHYLKFTPSSYGFGFDSLTLVEGSKVNRTITQLIAPEPPSLILNEVSSKHSTPEDVHLTLLLKEIVDITEDDKYWAAWNTSIALPEDANAKGIIDTGHPSVVYWVMMLLRPEFHHNGMGSPGQGSIGTRERGVRFELATKPDNMGEALAEIAFSKTFGLEWETTNLMSPFNLALQPEDIVVLKIIPAPNKSGNLTFLLTPYSKVRDVLGESKQVKSERMIMSSVRKNQVAVSLEITPVNDQPIPKTSADLARVPMLDPSQPSRATSVEEYVRLFYRDVDDTDMGMAVYQAVGGARGWWEYSLDNGATYVKMTELSSDPLPKYFGVGTTFLGVVDLDEVMKNLLCDIKGAMKNPSVLAAMMTSGNATCLNDVSKSGTDRLNATIDCPRVQAYMLPSEALLRFHPTTDTEAWDKADALRETRLVFGAWDQQERKLSTQGTLQVARMNVSIPNCVWECNCLKSVSAAPAVIAAEWADCHGGAVVSGMPKVADVCGVCGGDGTSCLDCASVVEGDAKRECGECVGGTTGKTAKRDCSGLCGEENELRRVGDVDVCVRKGQEDPTSCDGGTNSGAYVNSCGFCVGGTTTLGDGEGKDLCGVCSGTNSCVGCDGIVNSGAVWDLCGECRTTDDPNYNDCQAIGRVQPTRLDSAFVSLLDPAGKGTDAEAKILRRLTLAAEITGVDTKKYGMESCTLTSDKDRKVINTSDTIFRDTEVKATFRKLKLGTWTFACSFKALKSKKKILDVTELIAKDKIEVVDSTASSFEVDVKDIDSSAPTKVSIKVKDAVPLDGVTAYLLYQYSPDGEATRRRKRSTTSSRSSSRLVVELETEPSGKSTVTATLPSDLRPGQPTLGVASTPEILEMVKSGNIDLPMTPVTVRAPPPSVVNATLTPDERTLVVDFDINVESEVPCRDIVEWPWIDPNNKSPSPECQYRAARLTVKLGSGIAVEANSTLRFRANNGIRRAFGNAATAPEVTGTFVARRYGAPVGLQFQLTGDNQACNDSTVEATVSNIRGALMSEITVNWNVTWEPGVRKWSQTETLLIWENVQIIKERMTTKTTTTGETLSFPGNLMRQEIEYLIVAYITTSKGVSSEPKGVTVRVMPSSEAIKVRIQGPREVYADRQYKYTVVPFFCSETETVDDLNLKYFWSIDVKETSLSHEEGRMATIPAGSLQGGRTNTLTVTVIADDPDIMGTGTAVLVVLNQGIEVVTAADSIKIGAADPFSLDASGSRDLDNLPGDLNFRWSCMTEDGKGCFTQKDGKLTRFENAIPEERLTSPFLIVPPESLSVGKYKMTVEVWKEEVVTRRDVKVEIAPGKLPYIITLKPNSVILAERRIQVIAWITGEADLTTWWEAVQAPGFSYVDISQLPAGTKTTLKGVSNRRSYDLVLPKERSDKFEGLEHGTSYKFRLVVETPAGTSSFAEVILTTNNPPSTGSFEVTPSSGQALVTPFTFSASGWSDVPEDLPLTISFGYRIGSSDRVIWAFSTTDEDPSVELYLPADGASTRVTPLTRACDTNGGCSVLEGNAVTVTLPSGALPIAVFGNLSQRFTNELTEDDTSRVALDTARGIVSTLSAMGSDAQQRTFTMLVDLGVQEKVSSLLNRNADARRSSFGMVSSTLDLAEKAQLNKDTINDILSLTRQMMSDILGTPVRQDEDLAFQRKDLLTLQGAPTDDRIHFPATDSELSALRYRINSRFSETMGLHAKVDNSGMKRLKRETNSNTTEQHKLTTEQVLTALRATEKAFVEADTEGTKTARMDEMLQTIPGYLAGLCVGMSPQDEPRDVLGTYVGLTVVKSLLVNQADTKFTVVDSTVNKNDFVMNDSDITWGILLDSYNEWSCGRKGAEGEDLSCYGACLGTVQYKEDYISPVYGAQPPGEFRGSMVQGVLMNPETGVEIPLDSVPERIQINIVIENYTTPENKRLKCYAWVDNQWNGRTCGTGKLREDNGVRLQRCNCDQASYVSVFVVDTSSGGDDSSPTTSESPTVSSETTDSVPTEEPTKKSSKKITFIIPGNYSEIVGPSKESFERNLTYQLAEELQCPVLSIQNLTVSEGSVIVDFTLVDDYTRLSSGVGKSTEDLYMELYTMIQNGELEFKGPRNENLLVPPQELDGSGPAVIEKKNPTMLPIIIGAVVGGIVLIVLVLICVAIFLKNKKRGDKVQSLQTLGSKPPTYSSIHFENSLDGTVLSMSKRRNNQSRSLSSGGAYSDEGIYIERRSASGGSRNGSGGRTPGGSSVDSGQGGEVPEPFKYESPSKEELERSGPIPEHIIKKIKENDEEVLPGTPAGLE